MICLASMLILFSVVGSYGANYECNRRENRCNAALMHVTQAPQTPRDLLEACRAYEIYTTCIADARETCDPDNKKIGHMRHASRYVSRTCQEDHPTFEVISNNLHCVMKVAAETMLQPCLSENNRKAIQEHVRPLIANERNEVLACLWFLVDTECRTMKFSHSCGVGVGEAAEEILLNVEGGPDMCTPEIMKELYPFSRGVKTIVLREGKT